LDESLVLQIRQLIQGNGLGLIVGDTGFVPDPGVFARLDQTDHFLVGSSRRQTDEENPLGVFRWIGEDDSQVVIDLLVTQQKGVACLHGGQLPK
jgi:hypothetical protein